jgi:hypothetical protein
VKNVTPEADARQRPSLAELATARPRRGAGAPARSRSHYEAILRLLRERAEQGLGVLGSELYNSPEKFGRSPRNRISELRRDGHLIEGKPHGSADWFYKLIRDDSGVSPDSSDWYTAQTGKPRPSHPWKSAFSDRRRADADCFVLTSPEPHR